MIEVQVSKVDARKEEKVLLGMIMSTEFMGQLYSNIDLSLFSSKASRIIARWCLEYYNKYNLAPMNNLNTIYENSELELSDIDKNFIGSLLVKISDLSADTREYNVNYQLDQAYEFFKSRRLEKLIDKVNAELMVGALDKAENHVVQYMKVERDESTGIDLFRDIEKVKELSIDKRHLLFTPPKAVGELTGSFKRGDFVLFASRSKGGKSSVLQQLGAWAAVGAGLRVLHVSLEMLVEEVKDRYYSNFTGKRLTAYRGQEDVAYPYFDSNNRIQYYDINIPLMKSEDIESKAYDLNMMSKGGRLIVEARAENSFSVKDLEMLLDKYETQHDLIFDVVIVDYADIMITSDGRLEYRHRLDDIYKGLRGIAQHRSCLVLTATQSNRESFKKDTAASNVAEDYRKLAHVTHAFAINMSDEEKANKYWRLSTMVSRRQFFLEQDTVICLACMDIARMVVDSRWVNEVEIE